uniref:Ribosomal protein S15 n=1 Tax=Ascaris lumbricoides TaxID=6252 RepID=A0A0M3ISZ6_ASCLU
MIVKKVNNHKICQPNMKKIILGIKKSLISIKKPDKHNKRTQ